MQLTFSVKQSAEQQPQPSSSKELKKYNIASSNSKLQATIYGEIIWAVDVVLRYSIHYSLILVQKRVIYSVECFLTVA